MLNPATQDILERTYMCPKKKKKKKERKKTWNVVKAPGVFWNGTQRPLLCSEGKKKNREDIVNKAIVAALTPLLFGTIEIQSQIRRTHAGRQKWESEAC